MFINIRSPLACVRFLHWSSIAHSGSVLSKFSQVRGVLYCVFLLRKEQCTTGWLLVEAKFGMIVIACISEKIPGSILQSFYLPTYTACCRQMMDNQSMTY